MKIQLYNDKPEWLQARKGKITGSRAGSVKSSDIGKDAIMKELESLDILFKKTSKREELLLLLPDDSVKRLRKEVKKKIGYYELIAEKLAVSEEDFDGYVPNETPMDRGTRLESFAIKRFMQETGLEVDTSLIIWESEENPDIAISPDGVVTSTDNPNTEAVEAKCLASARHIEALITQQIPDDYFEQGIQYFVVNPMLDKLNFIFYDPRMVLAKDYFTIEMTRTDYLEEINAQKQDQIQTLQSVEEIVNSFFDF